ncbi:hypothetical protein K7X08_028147 [Anisodus acutangulus]|uniref:Uncharacterized protein n=1 Tax=Anisodus acutangulus TaxID=402998 RepID=A0A9Q1MYI3_9SOLA|nr:hypothetical protein K7X08_028147 [Anisodus acutangulus]
MSSSMSLLRSSIPLIAILVPPYLLFASFSGYGVLSISITTSVLVVSTLAFTFSKQNYSILKEHSSQVEQIVSHQQPQNGNFGQVEEVLSAENPRFESGVAQNVNFGQVEEVLSVQNPRIQNGMVKNVNFGQVEEVLSVQNPRTENGVAQNVNFRQVEEVLSVQNPRIENGVAQIHDLYSESESLGGPSSSSDQDSDIDWPFSGELEQSPLCSDGSISDEESLIEIALPSGQFVKDSPKLSFHQHRQKVFAESIFQQHCLMDLLADISDVSEEDNLIEIDISMGSIKCSGFEIAG